MIKKGHIVTHSHVVPNNNDNKTGRSSGGTGNRVDVTFSDGNTYSAKVIGRDPNTDIAILQITDSFTEEKLVPLSITNSSDLQVGQQVVVIGNPFGLGETNVKFYVSLLSSLPHFMTALHIDLISDLPICSHEETWRGASFLIKCKY
jgi:S1-C subfamily serine protease